ncbi:unnamed protein product [Protopolystoma xenopodis]|uniref:Uncharacterized protein n=1 Tax=Protopolystoma xenopodis TaxID=117903 RepID=A0A3S5AC21_9PLAT|nr:unnamed protein product [Protopolystoma xenopodis]
MVEPTNISSRQASGWLFTRQAEQLTLQASAVYLNNNTSACSLLSRSKWRLHTEAGEKQSSRRERVENVSIL